MWPIEIAGIKVYRHVLAVEVCYEWRIERHPIRKHRRQWRVVKHRIERPGAFQICNSIYMHPELFGKLKAATKAVEHDQ